MNRVIHFEIQAEEPERAGQFYRDVFDWKVEKWTGSPIEYWAVMTADRDSKEPGINGGILRRPEGTKMQECGSNAYVCTVGVANFDETAQKIISAGGKIAMPKFALVGMAWQGYFIDTEGNTFGIHQPDMGAK